MRIFLKKIDYLKIKFLYLKLLKEYDKISYSYRIVDLHRNSKDDFFSFTKYHIDKMEQKPFCYGTTSLFITKYLIVYFQSITWYHLILGLIAISVPLFSFFLRFDSPILKSKILVLFFKFSFELYSPFHLSIILHHMTVEVSF